MATPRFDEVGVWSEIKLQILEKYGSAYVRTFDKYSMLRKFYVDAFSGAGAHVSRSTGAKIEGSPSRALKIKPTFDHFYFIDLDQDKTDHLTEICGGRRNVTILTGDASQLLMEDVLPAINYKLYTRALCLLDPYGLHLDWQVIETAGKSNAVDMFLNFPVMDMNRNAIWHDPQKVSAEGIERMNRFWGDESWRRAAYAPSPQGDFFSDPDTIKQDNEIIVSAFCKRLKKVAEFAFVAEPLPMRNSRRAVVYYLIFATQKLVGNEIVTDIFSKYR
jgi:three-Cys-motif partner protein